MPNKIKAIVLGTTGMVGEGVLHECLRHTEVDKVLAINRKPCGVTHEKLTEIIHTDFFDLSLIENKLSGYDACYFCMGISSFGKKEEDYRRVTYDLTMFVAKTLHTINPDMTFTYVSGSGTDSTEKGRIMWARVKGKTENDLMKLFNKAYMFRPGSIQPTKGLKNAYKMYKVFAPFYPIWKTLLPKYVCTLEEVGKAMIYVTKNNSQKRVLENEDLRGLASLLS
jgi:hypothetical protein